MLIFYMRWKNKCYQNFKIGFGLLQRPCLVPKNFQDFPSHRIFGHMHKALNVVFKNNQLHSLAVNDEMNLLSLISLLLDTNYQIKIKLLQ